MNQTQYIKNVIYPYLFTKLYSDVTKGCVLYAGSITSGFRSKYRNILKDGHPFSWHLDGLALDCMIDNIKMKTKFIAYLRGLGYRVVEYKTELLIHIQYDFLVDHDFERIDEISHLEHILDTSPEIYEKIKKEIINYTNIHSIDKGSQA